MPASLDSYLSDGLEIDFDGDRMSATVPYHVKDLETPAGGSPLGRLAEAMNVVGVPEPGNHINLMGRDIYARRYRIGAWADADADLLVTWVEDVTALEGSGVEIEVGSTLVDGESDFEASERIKPWAERSPMYVLWNPAASGDTVDSAEFRQPVRLPYFAGKPFRRYTKTISEDPGEMSETFTGATNSTDWKGYPPETVLCWGIVGRNAGQGFRTNFDFGIDRITKWRQVGRAIKTTGEFPALTNAQVAGYNGIKDFVMQTPRDFNSLPV